MKDTITKREYEMLKKIFAAEIDHALKETRLPFCFQSKANKLLGKLKDKGLVEPTEFVLGGRMPMRVTGWALTHSGRFTYCANC